MDWPRSKYNILISLSASVSIYQFLLYEQKCQAVAFGGANVGGSMMVTLYKTVQWLLHFSAMAFPRRPVGYDMGEMVMCEKHTVLRFVY